MAKLKNKSMNCPNCGWVSIKQQVMMIPFVFDEPPLTIRRELIDHNCNECGKVYCNNIALKGVLMP